MQPQWLGTLRRVVGLTPYAPVALTLYGRGSQAQETEAHPTELEPISVSPRSGLVPFLVPDSLVLWVGPPHHFQPTDTAGEADMVAAGQPGDLEGAGPSGHQASGPAVGTPGWGVRPVSVAVQSIARSTRPNMMGCSEYRDAQAGSSWPGHPALHSACGPGLEPDLELLWQLPSRAVGRDGTTGRKWDTCPAPGWQWRGKSVCGLVLGWGRSVGVGSGEEEQQLLSGRAHLAEGTSKLGAGVI